MMLLARPPKSTPKPHLEAVVALAALAKHQEVLTEYLLFWLLIETPQNPPKEDSLNNSGTRNRERSVKYTDPTGLMVGDEYKKYYETITENGTKDPDVPPPSGDGTPHTKEIEQERAEPLVPPVVAPYIPGYLNSTYSMNSFSSGNWGMGMVFWGAVVLDDVSFVLGGGLGRTASTLFQAPFKGAAGATVRASEVATPSLLLKAETYYQKKISPPFGSVEPTSIPAATDIVAPLQRGYRNPIVPSGPQPWTPWFDFK